MKILLNIIAVTILFSGIFLDTNAQELSAFDSLENEFSNILADSPEQKDGPELYKPFLNYHLGTSYSWFGSGRSMMNYYFAPQITMPVSKKLSFHGGIMTSVYTPMVLNQGENLQNSTVMSVFSIYGAASYQLTENLSFYTSGVKHFSSFPGSLPHFYKPSDYFSVGSSLKLGDNVTIGASIHIRENHEFSSPFGPYNNLNSPLIW